MHQPRPIFHLLKVSAAVLLLIMNGCQAPEERAAGPGPTTEALCSVVDTDALLMPTGSAYGRSINGVAFQQEALLTHDGMQYAAWYTRQDNALMLARRRVKGEQTGDWEPIRLDGSSLVNGGPPGANAGWRPWNSHNVVSIGICPADGSIHVFYDMHGGRLRYRRSVPGLATNRQLAWSSDAFLAEQNWLESPGQPVKSMTYPRLASAPDGSLVLLSRVGGSGNGDLTLRRYRTARWSAPLVVVSRAGEYTDRFGASPGRNAYENGLSVGGDGSLHLSWTWREQRDPVANHGIGYAFSTDGGTTWRSADGSVVADTSAGRPITVRTDPVWITRTDRSLGTVNQQAQLFDNAGRMHVLMFHRRDDEPYQKGQGFWPKGVQAYFHYVLDPETRQWKRHQLPGEVGTRPKLGIDPRGNLYCIYLTKGTLVVQRATPRADFNDWKTITTHAGSYSGEGLIDPERLRESGILSIFAQRDGPDSKEPTGTALEVIELRLMRK